MKTAEGIFNETCAKEYNGEPSLKHSQFISKVIIPSMQAYAREALVAYRQKVIDTYNTSNGNDFEVMNIDLNNFIK